jgi:putative endonuclease
MDIQNPENRLKEHNSGKTKSTKSNVPYTIVFYEVCKTREEAIAKERFIKTGLGRAHIKNKLNKHT